VKEGRRARSTKLGAEKLIPSSRRRPAVGAFSDVFDRIARDMIGWTVQAL